MFYALLTLSACNACRITEIACKTNRETHKLMAQYHEAM